MDYTSRNTPKAAQRTHGMGNSHPNPPPPPLHLPPWYEMELALPPRKELLLEALGTLTAGESEFVDRAYSVQQRKRIVRYVGLRQYVALRQSVDPCATPLPPRAAAAGRESRVEDLMPPLCAMWYYACRILFDTGMPEWGTPPCHDFDVVFGDVAGPEHGDAPQECLQRVVEGCPAHGRCTYNPFLRWERGTQSTASEPESQPVDCARRFIDAQAVLVACLRALGPRGAYCGALQLINAVQENMAAWMPPDGPSSMPTYGAGTVDPRLHGCASHFMEVALNRACCIAIGLQEGIHVHMD